MWEGAQTCQDLFFVVVVFLMWTDLELFAQVRLEAELAKIFDFVLLGSCDTSVPTNPGR